MHDVQEIKAIFVKQQTPSGRISRRYTLGCWPTTSYTPMFECNVDETFVASDTSIAPLLVRG